MPRILAAPALLVVLACASAPAGSGSRPAPAATPGSAVAAAPWPPPGVVDGATGHRLAAEGVRILDVRTPEEFRAGHVPGALNIPYDQLGARTAEVGDPAAPVLLYCKTGRRSAIAAETLRASGFSRLYDMRSYEAWLAADRDAGR